MRTLVFEAQLKYDKHTGNNYYHGLVSFFLNKKLTGYKRLEGKHTTPASAMKEGERYCNEYRSHLFKVGEVGKILVKPKREEDVYNVTPITRKNKSSYIRNGSCIGYRT